MKQLISFIRMELFFSIRRNGFRIYYIVFAALMFLFVNVIGGAFPGVQISSDNFKINAPFFVDTIIAVTSLITTFAVASFAGMSALRDFSYNSYGIMFSYPVQRWQYIFGKFTGVYLANLLLYTALLIGFALACEMPWLHRTSFYPFSFLTYWDVFYQKIAVNLFFLTAAFFTLGLLVRSVVINWIAIIAFYVLYFLAGRYFRETGTRTLGALLDPYGLISTMAVSVGQGAEERNTSPISMQGLYLWNRLIWMGAGLLFLLLAAARFRFHFNNEPAFLKAFRKKHADVEKNVQPLVKPAYSLHQGAAHTWRVFCNQLRMECRHISRSIYFYLILLTAAVFLYFSSQVVGRTWETPSYPTTIGVAEILSGAVHIFIILLLVYGGESVWRDRQYRLQSIISATPASRIARFAAKTTAMYLLVLLMTGMVLVAGLLVQASRGFYDYELPLYIKYLFGYQSLEYLFYCIAVIALQSLAANRFQGYFAFALLYIFSNYIAYSVFQHGILAPGHMPEVRYSDLTGFQGSFYPFLVFCIYWLLFAVLLWRTGVRSFPQHEQQEGYRERALGLVAGGWLHRSRFTWIVLGGFIATGLFILYNTDVLNTKHSEKYYNKLRAGYEKKYEQLKNEPQPSIVRVQGNIDLLTAQRQMKAAMTLVLKNKTNRPVQHIYLNTSDEQYYSNWRSSKAWQQVLSDKKQNLFGYKLKQPLAPGDSLTLGYDFRFAAKGFTDDGIGSLVDQNGTFINSSIFLPVIGYNPATELTGNELRKEYGLRAKPYAPLPTDSIALNDNMLGHGADRIGLELTIGTTKGQTAIAPGYLTRQWDKDDRSYFTYAMDQPVVNYFSIQSGHYKQATEHYIVQNDTAHRAVRLSVYYHPKHAYNIGVMMQAMKDALEYYTGAFGPYQYRQLRIVEFPAASFAQSFANTIPFSENIGFLADLRQADDTADNRSPVDYVYYVTAHEVAHQWWAHQVLPANVEGFNFLCESLSQYSAAMLMKNKYGAQKVRKFLEQESFRYLTSRSGEGMEERPLARVLGNQQYVFYNKGVGAMYALQHYLGEENVNKVLRDFVRNYAYRERPYVTAGTLVDLLRQAAPDSVRYIVDDCLQNIVIYDNKIKTAAYSLNEETLEYTVDAVITGKKLVYNEKGKEREMAMNDYVTLGVFNTSGKEVASRMVRLHSGENHVRFTIPRRPATLMLNPDYDLEDKTYDARSRKVEVLKKG